ncbi:subtilisin-like protease [Olea europaea subsp. europaea]|uniref:Subtilisin-like protease n=1 Tax=Olea europaea subsp. europaea TaxID=158383 RepID=A0A8S0QXK6_OLEEU|nr:subtilisin-like protease [Olea europaea subsp. europaea]
MKTSKNNLLFLFFNLCIIAVQINAEERKPYIIYMGGLHEDTQDSKFLMDEHHSLLSEAIGDELIARNSKIHSYRKSFNGFVAKLLPHEAELLSKKDGVVSVFQNKVQNLRTTRSWDFLGMPVTVNRKKEESDMIVALIDTGIYVQSPSFDDKGYGPPPAKWKGKCVKAGNFTGCNNKVIGAQYFQLEDGPPEEKSPADFDGHGSHTASTAAGNTIHGANLYGIAEGTARGGVPSARLAIYKVCWTWGCSDMDILAAYDSAIADGVDIISSSLGGYPRDFFQDPIAIGAFHAMKKGILTSCAAGNDGPLLATVENVAPWILTVAASSIDRRYETPITLGNGEKFTGTAINTFEPKERMYSLTSGAQAQNVPRDPFGNASACDYGTLNQNKVKGKILYCKGLLSQDSIIYELGGAGIIMSDYTLDTAYPNLIPGTLVSTKDELILLEKIVTRYNPADVGTKVIPLNKFKSCLQILNIDAEKTLGHTVMKTSKNNLLFLFFNLCIIAVQINAEERKPYIIYMGGLHEDTQDSKFLMDEHHSLLSEAIGDELIARNSKIHSYRKSFNGFVAKLLPHEAELLSKKDGVVSVFQNKVQKLRTTRSWDFLGMPVTVNRKKEESDMIVALIDTGIYVQSPSFNDKGYGPPPAKWKGKCVKAGNFTGCNNKVIGAQYFQLEDGPPEEKSPADFDGHGSHTASTAAGNTIHGANLYGIAEGTARGGVPSARLAIYKVCWTWGCSDMDILAAYDSAIADGVDIISSSLGGYPRDFFQDPIAIGAFHAMKKGILTSCAAGNDGPLLATVENVAPWILTVAASSIDRRYETPITLGNGEKFTGIAINTFEPKERMYSLTSGAQAQNVPRDPFGNASACDYGTLNQNKVKGKILYCKGLLSQDSIIYELGGAGIIMSDYTLDTAYPNLIPGTLVSTKDGAKIDKYINSTRNAQAVISKTATANMTAPFIASFSSRGPQTMSSNILKPDVAAPGLDILASYSQLATMSGEPIDKRVVKFNIISGTSMACPHVSGAAAYVKSFHPDWSVAAIKSALMTTGKPRGG